MRKIAMSLLLIISITCSFSQEVSFDYYPLHVGNEWKYHSLTTEFNEGKLDTIEIDTILTKVIADTIMPNGLLYYQVRGIDGGFRRIDSLTSKVYEYYQEISPDSIIELLEWELFDFSISDSLYWINGLYEPITITTSQSEERVGLLDEYAQEKVFQGAYYFPKRIFSKGFGISYFEYGCMPPMTYCTLIGAKIDNVEYSTLSSVRSTQELPQDYEIYDLYPNPFNASTVISFKLTEHSFVSIKIFNMLGQEKITLLENNFSPGTYKVKWGATSENSGIYLVKINFNQRSIVKKCLLIK